MTWKENKNRYINNKWKWEMLQKTLETFVGTSLHHKCWLSSAWKFVKMSKNVEHEFLPLSEMSAWKFFYNIPKLLYQQLRYWAGRLGKGCLDLDLVIFLLQNLGCRCVWGVRHYILSFAGTVCLMLIKISWLKCLQKMATFKVKKGFMHR